MKLEMIQMGETLYVEYKNNFHQQVFLCKAFILEPS